MPSLGASEQSDAAQDIVHQVRSTEANTEATITMQRSRFLLLITTCVVIILILLGGVVITTSKLIELKVLLNPGLSQTDFPSLSRKEGVVPSEVWHWIVDAKAKMALNPKSAHALLRVSSDGKSLFQASSSSPPRVPTAETYLKCICVSSKSLFNARVYFELQVTQTVPWTLGFRTESFDADHMHDSSSDAGIWTIASTDGKIVINDGQATPTPYATPARVGLYLDFKSGQLSFYDAVAKLHLHTYLVSFKEKLLFYAAVDVGTEETHNAFITFS